MTRFASEARGRDTPRLRPALGRLSLLLARRRRPARGRLCRRPAAPGAPAASARRRRRTPHPPLVPAQPGADPFSLLAWVFTPIFQVMFIILVAVYEFSRASASRPRSRCAIIVLTLIVRTWSSRCSDGRLVSQRRMQLLQPEIKEIQRRYKGDSVKARTAQQELYKERGINPCGLPARCSSRCRCCSSCTRSSRTA